MKKIYSLLFIVLIGIGLPGCKKETAKTPETLNIVGSWKLTSLSSDYIFGDKVVLSYSNQSVEDYVDHLNFNSDGTGTMLVNDAIVRTFTYTVDTDKNSLC